MDLSRLPRLIVGMIWGSIAVPLSMFLILIGGNTLYTLISLCLIFIFLILPFVLTMRNEEISVIATFGLSYSVVVILLWKTNTIWSPLSLPGQILSCLSYSIGFLCALPVRLLRKN
jgi:hypothetical protein